MTRWIGPVVVLLMTTACQVLGGGGGGAEYLRCENRVAPLGIDTPRPRFSWRLAPTGVRGQAQTAYRVLVASSSERLAGDEGDLWDSGRVASNATHGVEYAGVPLAAGDHVHWKVRTWDETGEPTPWSAPTRFVVGILDPADWQAPWIGYDAARAQAPAPVSLEGAQWIWHAADEPFQAPAEQRFFRGTWEVPAGFDAESVRLFASVDNRFTLSINGRAVDVPPSVEDAWREVRTFAVGSFLGPGTNVIAVRAKNDSPGAAGVLLKLRGRGSDGETFERVTDGTWRSATEAMESWTATDFDDTAWSTARVLASHGEGPWGKIRTGRLFLPPPSYLRRTFAAPGPVRRATLFASALGLYEVHLNGTRVGDDWFTPGWTDYTQRVLYNTYDVTELVATGENTLGAVLADGWFSGHVGLGSRRDHYGDATRFRAQLLLEYADGTREVVGTDGTWRAATGPLREADLLMGEAYDARREMPGWDAPGFDDAAWGAVDVTEAVEVVLGAYPAQTVGEIARLATVALTEPTPGVYIFDLGQNFAGVARLRVRGAAAGDEIVVRHGERLNPDGTLYTENLRGARATDRYVCRGDAVEEWHPRFTFHGFQYVEVTGLATLPAPEDVEGIALGSRTPRVGTLVCDDPVLNRLVENIHWTQRMNFLDIPTDCPQRDERLGWTGDAQIYVRTATWLCDVEAFFTKWLTDLADAQRADGQFPTVAPLKTSGSDGGPAWSDAGTVCPWTIYEVYGDRRLLERHYPGMRRYVAFCEGRCTEELLPPAEFHCFGDWVNIGANTPKEVIFQAYFGLSTRLTARAARVLGYEEDAEYLDDLFQRIRASFQRAYVADDGRIHGDTQCAYVLALAFDLLDEPARTQAAAHLVRTIEERDWHLSTGFVGTKDLMLVLSKIGREDVAYRLLHNDTFPSWGFSIANGATTIWERWNGWTPEEGFNDPGMNSFAHYSFGAVGQWMFQTIGGIDLGAPGFDEIVIRPKPGGNLTRATTTYRSRHGTISTAWRREGDALSLDVEIPPNTTALVHVPSAADHAVREGGRPLTEAEGIVVLGREDGATVLRVDSGRYSFLSR